jgi:hypothetical protein
MTVTAARRCHAVVHVSAPSVYRPHSTEEVAMSTPDESAKGVKTLGIKLKPDVHAQLSFIAGLRDGTITDEILIAITAHIARAKDDPELRNKAAAAREEIEREAAARQQAIATLFDGTAGGTPPQSAEPGGEALDGPGPPAGARKEAKARRRADQLQGAVSAPLVPGPAGSRSSTPARCFPTGPAHQHNRSRNERR